MEIRDITKLLKEYDGRPLTIMEVCGSHTAAISKNGIKSMLSDKIKLVSGPGCPVCVTASAYVDKLIDLSLQANTHVATFGDLIRVPGSTESLQSAKAKGAKIDMVYSPLDVLALAEKNPEITYVFGAVGFETTAPVYTVLLDQAIKQNLSNIKLLTSLKTMPEVIDLLLSDKSTTIDAFIAPGHVCAVTGSELFRPLCEKYHIPFAVSGFEGEELLIAIYGLVKMCEQNTWDVKNYYTSVVESQPNAKITANVEKYFEKRDATWRGIGSIPESGMYLRTEYAKFDAGSYGLDEDIKMNKACLCGQVLRGKATSKDCPLFGKVCTPKTPQGACMVSYEGCCFHAYQEK